LSFAKFHLFFFLIKLKYIKCIIISLIIIGFNSCSDKNQGDFSTSPAFPTLENPEWIVIEAKPGEVIKSAVYFHNLRNDKNISLVAQGRDAIEIKENERKEFKISPAINEQIGIGKWIEIDKTDINISPNKRELISFEISIPEDVEKKIYYGAIVARQLLQTNSNIGNLNINLEVGTRIYLTITDNPKNSKTIDAEAVRGRWQIVKTIFWSVNVVIIFTLIYILFFSKQKHK